MWIIWPVITDKLTQELSWTSDLEVVPDIHHAALHKRLSGLFLQWRPSNVQSVDISQVINAANINPVPGANLYTKTSCHIEFLKHPDTFNIITNNTCCSWNMVNNKRTQTDGPSFFCPAFFMCCLTSWRPLFLPSLLAIHSVRWNPVSPEMAMWRLMVSMKRTLEAFREENSVLYTPNHKIIQ